MREISPPVSPLMYNPFCTPTFISITTDEAFANSGWNQILQPVCSLHSKLSCGQKMFIEAHKNLHTTNIWLFKTISIKTKIPNTDSKLILPHHVYHNGVCAKRMLQNNIDCDFTTTLHKVPLIPGSLITTIIFLT